MDEEDGLCQLTAKIHQNFEVYLYLIKLWNPIKKVHY